MVRRLVQHDRPPKVRKVRKPPREKPIPEDAITNIGSRQRAHGLKETFQGVKGVNGLKAVPILKKMRDVWDADQPGLAVRVSPKGRKTFIVVARFNGKSQSRRAIGEYPTMDLAEAQEKARHWRGLLKKGKDPALEEQAAKREELRKRAITFESVVEAFAATALKHQRKGAVVKRQLEREFVELWAGRPIDSIERAEVAAAIQVIANRGAIHEAHNCLGVLRRLYTWAINCGAYGLESSPCDRLRPKDVIGVGKTVRRRVLEDPELIALWRATEPARMEYPFAPMYRLLLVTGQRKSEVAEAVWSEFDLEKKLWTIPAERMKADRPHEVPLSDMAVAILEALPRFKGPHLFTTTLGAKPVSGFSKSKRRLDGLMRQMLKKFEPFRVQDIRRTVRTRLSAAPVEEHVRELVMAHAQPELKKRYDHHHYLDEKRGALDWWAARLRDVVNPASGENVVAFPATGVSATK